MSSIKEEEEGCVIYILNSHSNEVVSICKVKTLEYRFLRKMREKLRNCLDASVHSRVPNVKMMVQTYRSECESLLKDTLCS